MKNNNVLHTQNDNIKNSKMITYSNRTSKMITLTPWQLIISSTLENDNILAFKNGVRLGCYHLCYHLVLSFILCCHLMLSFLMLSFDVIIRCYHLVLSFGVIIYLMLSFDVIISHSLQMLSFLCYHFFLYSMGVIIYLML